MPYGIRVTERIECLNCKRRFKLERGKNKRVCPFCGFTEVRLLGRNLELARWLHHNIPVHSSKARSDLPLFVLHLAHLPEECAAELCCLQCRMERKNVPLWKIHLRIYSEVLALLWSFYIQIPIENRFLLSDDCKIDE